MKYKTLAEFKVAFDAGKHPGAFIVIDNDGVWVQVEGETATIGVTDYAQKELGDIVFVELPPIGDHLIQADPFGTVEAVKAVSEIYAPVSGEVIEINVMLDNTPQIINQDPYGEGWMVKVKLANQKELENLLSPEEYRELTGD